MLLDKNNPPEKVIFDDRVFCLMGGRRKYYLEGNKQKQGSRPKGLHVAIWEKHNGREVPKGFEVHHKNQDTFDCQPENLECLLKIVHRKLPREFDRELNSTHLERIRPLASAWHRSEEGRKWHKKNAESSMSKAIAAGKIANSTVKGMKSCTHCGKQMTFKSPRKKFCSYSCQTGVMNPLKPKLPSPPPLV